MRKSYKFIVILISILFLSGNSFAQLNHVYINGKIINFSDSSIQIDSSKEVFTISKNARIVKHVKKTNAIYEEPATLKELRLKDSVTLKVIENTVHELIIEEYKR